MQKEINNKVSSEKVSEKAFEPENYEHLIQPKSPKPAAARSGRSEDAAASQKGVWRPMGVSQMCLGFPVKHNISMGFPIPSSMALAQTEGGGKREGRSRSASVTSMCTYYVGGKLMPAFGGYVCKINYATVQ